MYLSEQLQNKWAGVLDHPDLPKIADPYRKAVTAVVLENQAVEMQKSAGILNEGSPTNAVGTGGFGGGAAAGGPVAGFDPILISLVRRSLPNLIAYDVCGVQPMTGPTGLIFAMRSTLTSQNVTAGAVETFYNEVDTAFSGTGAQTAISLAADTSLGNQNVFSSTMTTGTANTTGAAENYGSGAAGSGNFNEMAFSIEKVTSGQKTVV